MAGTAFALIRNLEISAQPLRRFLLAGRMLAAALRIEQASTAQLRQSQSCCLPVRTARGLTVKAAWYLDRYLDRIWLARGVCLLRIHS